MKIEKAVQILSRQRESLNSINPDTAASWKTQCESYIGSFFGFDSPEFKFIAENKFNSPVYEMTEYYVEQQKPVFASFVDNCIQTIKDKGLHKKSNFLSRIDDKWLVPLCLLGLTGLLGVGTLWGKNIADTQNIELRRSVKDLKDTLTILRSSPAKLTDTIPHQKGKDTAATQQKK